MVLSGCLLKVGVIGLSHKTAPLLFREEIAKGADALAGEKGRFFPHATVLLSTCNRTEVYFSADDLAQAHSDLLLFLRRHIKGAFEHRLYSYFNLDCFLHLCKVTAGLDSAVLAETEIQRQVKMAYARAAQNSSLPACLHFIFQKGLRVGKSARSKGNWRGAVSLPQTIWQIAEVFLDRMFSRKVLFIGYSEMNRTLISYFEQKGIDSFTLCTTNPSQVQVPYPCVDRSALEDWENFDCIICASLSDGYLIHERKGSKHI